MTVFKALQAFLKDKAANHPIMVHTSLRTLKSVTPAQELHNVFQANGNTVMVPAFSDRSKGETLKQTLDPALGYFPQYLLNHPASKRTTHPYNSFIVTGPQTDIIINNSPKGTKGLYAPIQTLADSNGYFLLAGTDYTTATFIHYAEQLAGYVMPTRNHLSVPYSVGTCSRSFNNLETELDVLSHKLKINDSLWRLLLAQQVLEVASDLIKTNPMVVVCQKPDCERCVEKRKQLPL